MNTSATQLETLDLCRRKWKFRYSLRLPTLDKGSLGFGTALHSCAERFLKGKDPFEAGWEEGLEPAEAALIRVLVEKGIDAGYLEQRPGGEAEQDVTLAVMGLMLKGKVDYRTKDRIEDHKSSKNARYLKGPKALKESIQMNVYGKERLEFARSKGLTPPPIVTFVHNQFIKDPEAPAVKRTEAEVTPSDIERFWADRIEPLALLQIETEKVEDPFDLPNPPVSACRAFGGCDFCTICAGSESIDAYTARINNLKKKEKPMTDEVKPVNPSDFLKARAAAKAAAAGGAPPQTAINPPAPATATVSADQAPSGEQKTPPPWFHKDCPMCAKKVPGFHMQQKKPCRICLSMSKVSTDGFEWEIGENGTVSWWVKGERVAEVPQTPAEDKGSKVAFSADDLFQQLARCKTVEEVAELCGKAESVVGEDGLESFMATAAARIDELSATPPAEPPKKPKEPKEPKKPKEPKPTAQEVAEETLQQTVPAGIGPMLLIGCAPIKGAPNQIVIRAEEMIAKHFPDYWKAENVFDARKEVRNRIEQIVKGYHGWAIVQTGRDPDVDNLMSALIPFAAIVIRGTVQ